MITNLFKLWKKSKKERASKLAAELVKTLNDIGRIPAQNGRAASITIYEYSHREDLLEMNGGPSDNIVIKFSHKGKVIE